MVKLARIAGVFTRDQHIRRVALAVSFAGPVAAEIVLIRTIRGAIQRILLDFPSVTSLSSLPFFRL